MIGKNEIIPRINADEALSLFRYANAREMHIAKELYDAYRAKHGTDQNALWDMLRVLSFIYDTGRVQGIREERARKTTATD